MTGITLAKKMETRSDIPIIVFTGIENRSTFRKLKDLGVIKIFLKPVEMKAMGRFARNTLDGR